MSKDFESILDDARRLLEEFSGAQEDYDTVRERLLEIRQWHAHAVTVLESPTASPVLKKSAYETLAGRMQADGQTMDPHTPGLRYSGQVVDTDQVYAGGVTSEALWRMEVFARYAEHEEDEAGILIIAKELGIEPDQVKRTDADGFRPVETIRDAILNCPEPPDTHDRRVLNLPIEYTIHPHEVAKLLRHYAAKLQLEPGRAPAR